MQAFLLAVYLQVPIPRTPAQPEAQSSRRQDFHAQLERLMEQFGNRLEASGLMVHANVALSYWHTYVVKKKLNCPEQVSALGSLERESALGGRPPMYTTLLGHWTPSSTQRMPRSITCSSGARKQTSTTYNPCDGAISNIFDIVWYRNHRSQPLLRLLSHQPVCDFFCNFL